MPPGFLGAQRKGHQMDNKEMYARLGVSEKKKMATRKGLEPSTSSVTGWHSNRLNYRAV